MLKEYVFECLKPKFLCGGMEELYPSLLVGEYFIVTFNEYQTSNTVESYWEADTRFLHLCNRFTRSWTSIRFPDSHAHFNSRGGGLGDEYVELLGFFRPNVIAVLIDAYYGQPSDKNSLELWQISDNLDSLHIVHASSIALSHLPLDSKFKGFFPMENIMHIVFEPCILIECTTSSTKASLEFSGDAFVHAAMMYDGKLYLLCDDITGVKQNVLYKCCKGKLEYVTLFTKFKVEDCYGFSSCGSKLFALAQNFAVASFDVSTLLWTMYRAENPSSPHFFIDECAPLGEIHGIVKRGVRLQETWICILSLVPPRLSVLALRALQQNMPKETAEKVALEKSINGPMRFAKFLLRSNTQDSFTK